MGRRKKGTARILSQREIELVTRVLKQHRYFEKNHAILSLSFELGLTPKEIASLNIVDVVTFSNKKHWHSVFSTTMIKHHQGDLAAVAAESHERERITNS